MFLDVLMVVSILVMFVGSIALTWFVVALKLRSLSATTEKERAAAEERMVPLHPRWAANEGRALAAEAPRTSVTRL
jgi:hypothetical protein